MDFIPRYLAKRFSYFESFSVPKFFLFFFGTFFLSVIISMQLGENAEKILGFVFSTLFLICFAGFVSAQHFSRKPWIPSAPFIVQLTSKEWFNSILSLLSFLRHWCLLVFVNLVVVMVFVVCIVAAIQVGQ